MGIQGTGRESVWLQLFKLREGRVIDEVEETELKRSYEKPRDEFILGILVSDKGNNAYVLTVK